MSVYKTTRLIITAITSSEERSRFLVHSKKNLPHTVGKFAYESLNLSKIFTSAL